MAKIKVQVGYPIDNGVSITFLAPCKCLSVDGLTVKYEGGTQNFVFKDAHGHNLAGTDNLFTPGALIKVVLDVTNSAAYIQNADSNGYLEQRLEGLDSRVASLEAGGGGGGGGAIVVDDHLSVTSENPVQNKVITQQMNDMLEDLQDARVDVWGETHDNPGDAIRHQINKLGLSIGDVATDLEDLKNTGGTPGEDGQDGEDGATFTPSVSADGVLSWTNDKGLDNPSPVNIKGPAGNDGNDGQNGATGNGIQSVAKTGTSGLVDTYTITFTNGSKTTFTVTNGQKGDTGATGSTGVGVASVVQTTTSTADGGTNVITVTLTDGTKATFNVKNGGKGSTGATGADGKDYVLTDADRREIAGMVGAVEIPAYWDSHLNSKIADIKALQDEGGKDAFSFVVMSDMHYEQNLAKLAPTLAKKIVDECGIKYVLILGDCGTRNGILKDLNYIDGEWDNIEKMIAPIRDRLLITDGNHDGSYGATDGDGDGVIDDVHGTGNSAFNYTPQKKYNRIKRKVSLVDGVTFDESGCGYYADDKTAKMRYIVLSTHNNKYEENEDGSSKYSNMNNFRYGQSQFDMVVKALSTLEDGWSVLVASHVPLDRSGELLPWGATEVEDDRLVSGEVECWVMADVLNAFVNKSTYSGNFAGTQGAVATYKNLADKTSTDWKSGYRTSSSGLTQESGFDVTNFLGDGKTPVGDMTIYYKNATMSNQRLLFYNANKEQVYACYPTTFSGYEGFDGTATEGRLFIDKNKNGSLYTTAVYVRLCLVSGDTAPIITLDEPIEASGNAFDAVSVDVDFTNAKGTLVGYFGGHVHKDGAWGDTYTWNGRLKQCDFWTITTRCDGNNENDSALFAERVAGTTTEQSFDVFTVNKAARTIHATKIGAGSDRVIQY